jgi:hypothetical protein
MPEILKCYANYHYKCCTAKAKSNLKKCNTQNAIAVFNYLKFFAPQQLMLRMQVFTPKMQRMLAQLF